MQIEDELWWTIISELKIKIYFTETKCFLFYIFDWIGPSMEIKIEQQAKINKTGDEKKAQRKFL